MIAPAAVGNTLRQHHFLMDLQSSRFNQEGVAPPLPAEKPVAFWQMVAFASLAVATASCGGPGSPAEATANHAAVHLFLGTTQSTSGVYSFGVAVASVVARHDPGLMVTVVESNGAYDNAKRMKEGIFHWSVSGSPAVYSEVRNGTGYFERYGAWEPIRLMFLRSVNIARVYVRADMAGAKRIRSWTDLGGKRVGPGMPGTRDMSRILDIDRILGTGIRFVPGSLADSVASLKEGRIIALVKGSPVNSFDASMLECHYSTPLTVIGFSQAEADRIQREDSLQAFADTPMGAIRNAPAAGGFLEMASPAMALSSSFISQEIGYRMMKAVYAGWNEIADAFPPCRGLDPIRDAILNIPDADGFFFHAGVIQFAQEIGLDIPRRHIPPEYNESR